MTSSTVSAPLHPRASFVATGSGLHASGIIRSEWIKLRSVRSTFWSYLLLVGMSVGLAAIVAMTRDLGTQELALTASEQASIVSESTILGVFFGQLVVAVLGVLSISGEYTTGMIKSTLTAVPGRLAALWAKGVVLFLTTFAVALVSAVGSVLVAMPILAGKGIYANLLDSAVFLPLLAGAFYLALVSVFALGLGTILRSSAGGVATVLGILLLLPIVLSMIPAAWASDLSPYLLSNAGMGLSGLSGPAAAEFWKNLAIIVGWVVTSLAGAAVLLRRRDA